MGLKTSIDEARAEISDLLISDSGLDIRAINVVIRPINVRRRRRSVEADHTVVATFIHILAEGQIEPTGDQVAAPLVAELSSVEIDYTGFTVRLNEQPTQLSVLPDPTTTSTTTTTTTSTTTTT